MDNDVLTWVELIVAAVLQKGDAQPLIDLALRAGVDLDALQCVLNATLDGVRDQLMSTAGIVGWLARPGIDDEELFSVDDLAALKKLGIDAE